MSEKQHEGVGERSFADQLDTSGVLDDLIFVSVDDHIIEPPHLFEGRLPAKYQDLAPKVVTRDDGAQAWVYDGDEVYSMGLNAVVGRPPEEWGLEPDRLEDMRKGCWDVNARINDMNIAGVLGSMSFPSYAQFCGQRFFRSKDKDLGLAVLQAYNDWHVDEWCGTHPDRLMPLGIVPLWDPELMAAEVRRLDSKGCHAVTFSEDPHKLGLPPLHDRHWYPFWEACEQLGTVVCLHLGSSSSLPATSPGSVIETSQTLAPLSLLSTATEIVWSPFLRDFPDLKIALSEGGIGWIPYFLERIDYVYRHHRHWTGTNFGDKLPSDVFKEHVISCFIEDRPGLRLKDEIGVDMICWEMDYPHSDSSWPAAPESFAPSLEHLTREEIDKITYQNALRLFRWDPFRHRRPEDSTVKALRSETDDMDLLYKSAERLRNKGVMHPRAEDLTAHFVSR
jgi:predicted TIM-barrel fold metal-dependent hydrolase